MTAARVCGLALALAAASGIACDKQERGGAAPAEPAAEAPPKPLRLKAADGSIAPEAPPHVDLDHVEHRFGQLVQGAEVRHAFTVVNNGAGALLLYSEPGQNCSVPSYPPEIAGRGGRVTFEVLCRFEQKGDIQDTVILRSSYDKKGVVAEQVGLKLTAQVAAAAAFERELVTARLPFGSPKTEEIRVVGVRAGEVRLGKPRIEMLPPEHPDPDPAAAAKPLFELRKLPAAGGKPEGLAVVIGARNIGSRSGRVIVPTGIAQPKEIDLAFTITVAGTLEIVPPDLMFLPGVPEARERTFDVKSAQPGFAVKQVKVERGPFDAALERGDAPGAYRVKVTLRDDKAKPDENGVLGLVRVISNDRAEGGKLVALRLIGFEEHHGHGHP